MTEGVNEAPTFTSHEICHLIQKVILNDNGNCARHTIRTSHTASTSTLLYYYFIGDNTDNTAQLSIRPYEEHQKNSKSQAVVQKQFLDNNFDATLSVCVTTIVENLVQKLFCRPNFLTRACVTFVFFFIQNFENSKSIQVHWFHVPVTRPPDRSELDSITERLISPRLPLMRVIFSNCYYFYFIPLFSDQLILLHVYTITFQVTN